MAYRPHASDEGEPPVAWVCLNCGVENEDDEHTFCSACGAEQGTTHAEPASTVAMEPDEVEGDAPLGDPGDEAIAAMPDEAAPDETRPPSAV